MCSFRERAENSNLSKCAKPRPFQSLDALLSARHVSVLITLNLDGVDYIESPKRISR